VNLYHLCPASLLCGHVKLDNTINWLLKNSVVCFIIIVIVTAPSFLNCFCWCRLVVCILVICQINSHRLAKSLESVVTAAVHAFLVEINSTVFA